MTFAVIETSNDDGRPIYLYSFTLGSATWRYTSSDSDVTVNGYVWKAVPISDDGVKLTGDAVTDNLTITAPNTIAPVQMFFGSPPSQAIMVRIYHYHEGDTDSVLGYMGELTAVNQPQPGVAMLTCDSISASMRRDGLRLAWQRTCPYALYDAITCKVDKTVHGIKLVVADVIGSTVYFNGFDGAADGRFDGGFIEWEHPSRGTEFLGIETQVGATCGMFGVTDGIYYGLEVMAYPGCNRTTSQCAVKFNNLDNFGGVPDMPGKSPFDGDPVF
jgi:uncharacterized phage protein (TIGR02218 family)